MAICITMEMVACWSRVSPYCSNSLGCRFVLPVVASTTPIVVLPTGVDLVQVLIRLELIQHIHGLEICLDLLPIIPVRSCLLFLSLF